MCTKYPKTDKTVGAVQPVEAVHQVEAVQPVKAVQPVEAVEPVELIEVVKHNSNTYLNTPQDCLGGSTG